MKLRTQIEHYLKSRGMTASGLARAAGVPRQNISNWLMNQKPRDIEQVKRVADVFGISLDELLFGNGIVTYQKPLSFIGDGTFEVSIRKIK